jgi:hypothetical protein
MLGALFVHSASPCGFRVLGHQYLLLCLRGDLLTIIFNPDL